MSARDGMSEEPSERAEQRGGAIRGWLSSVRPERRVLGAEALAGLPGAIGSVPDGMAASLLAGVNPIHGLYASMIGPIVGGLSASTAMVVITTTNAAALAAGSALEGVPAADRPAALFLLTALAGVLMVAAGVARFGRFVRFVANSVMVGFLTGVAVNIIFVQLADATGVDPEGSVGLTKAVYVVTHPGQIHLPTLLAALSALAIIVLANRSKLQPVAALLALVIPSVVAALADASGIATVSDIGAIPRGVPLPGLPELRLFSPNLIAGAFAVAVIVLVQGSGVSESAPNPDGTPSDANRDFVAQGLGNVAAGFFQGQPVGGSVGQTALNLSAGARSRWASIFSGVWMLVILVALSGIVGSVVMATLAAVLIYAAVGAIKPAAVELTLRTSRVSLVAGLTTFIATLLLPVAVAVGIGVALSLLLQVNRESLDLTLVELDPREDGTTTVRPSPKRLRSHEVTVLDIYGSLLFAGARTLEARLPDPAGTERPAVVLRLRGRTQLSTTAIQVLSRYAKKLDAVGGRLYLSGVDPETAARAERRGAMDVLGPIEIVRATEILGASSREAFERARRWVEQSSESEDVEG
jgi:SulP family sulfate permease